MGSVTKQFEMPERRGIWFYSYEQIKHNTRGQWRTMLVTGGLALGFGVFSAAGIWQRTLEYTLFGKLISQIVPVAMICYGLLDFPAALIYFYRKRRGIPVDVWDCETPNDPAVLREHAHHKSGESTG